MCSYLVRTLKKINYIVNFAPSSSVFYLSLTTKWEIPRRQRGRERERDRRCRRIKRRYEEAWLGDPPACRLCHFLLTPGLQNLILPRFILYWFFIFLSQFLKSVLRFICIDDLICLGCFWKLVHLLGLFLLEVFVMLGGFNSIFYPPEIVFFFLILPYSTARGRFFIPRSMGTFFWWVPNQVWSRASSTPDCCRSKWWWKKWDPHCNSWCQNSGKVTWFFYCIRCLFVYLFFVIVTMMCYLY